MVNPDKVKLAHHHQTFAIFSTGSVLGLVLALAAYWYRRDLDAELSQQLNIVLHGLLLAEDLTGPDSLSIPPRVAVGFGACKDVIVPALPTLTGAGIIPPEHPPEHVRIIQSKDDLQNMFAYFFQHGAAAERYITNETLFDTLLSSAWLSEEAHTALGGNAAVMANRFKQEGCHVLLGATVTNQLRDQIHPDIIVAGEILESDDVHLSLEYKKNETWGKFITTRANRFFFHSDKHNPLIYSLDEFASHIVKFTPDLLVIGGLQMMDNFPFDEGERLTRLLSLSEFLFTIPQHTPTHFEMASFGDANCLRDIIEHVVVPHVNSLGLNEQELPIILAVLDSAEMDKNGTIPLVSDANPRIATTLDAMRNLYKLLKAQNDFTKGEGITRIHVHTLAFQAVLTAHNSVWKSGLSAAAHASLTAHRHVCASGSVHIDRARLLMDDGFSTTSKSSHDARRIPFRSDHPVECWDETYGGVDGTYQLCVAPVLVCTEVVQTGGGGDNISSAALAKQI